MEIEVREAVQSDLIPLSKLFDEYRQFYEQGSDIERATSFIDERFKHKDSVLLVASHRAHELVGFTQLFPAFSSVATARTFVLNDLYVSLGHRKHGVAKALLRAACQAGSSRGAVRLTLSTAVTNLPAQQLYEREGWAKNERFFQYGISLPRSDEGA